MFRLFQNGEMLTYNNLSNSVNNEMCPNSARNKIVKNRQNNTNPHDSRVTDVTHNLTNGLAISIEYNGNTEWIKIQ
jgi:hypothetical protein